MDTLDLNILIIPRKLTIPTPIAIIPAPRINLPSNTLPQTHSTTSIWRLEKGGLVSSSIKTIMAQTTGM